MFSSKTEHFPYIQWHLANRTKIRGIVISNPNRQGGENLKDVEIRAGLAYVDDSATGKLRLNDYCGRYEGPGSNRRAYTIMCDKDIEADYITLQILDNNATLQINEMEIIKASEGNIWCINIVLVQLCMYVYDKEIIFSLYIFFSFKYELQLP